MPRRQQSAPALPPFQRRVSAALRSLPVSLLFGPPSSSLTWGTYCQLPFKNGVVVPLYETGPDEMDLFKPHPGTSATYGLSANRLILRPPDRFLLL